MLVDIRSTQNNKIKNTLIWYMNSFSNMYTHPVPNKWTINFVRQGGENTVSADPKSSQHRGTSLAHDGVKVIQPRISKHA